MQVNRRGLFGIVLVLLGTAWILNNFDLIPYQIETLFFNWPMLLIVLGGVFVLSNSRETTGWVLLVVGGVFWAFRVLDLSFNFHAVFWPLIVIAIGVAVLLRSFGEKKQPRHQTAEMDEEDVIDEVVVFGGNKRRITSKSFQGGKITSIFGGAELYFHETDLAVGRHVLDLFVLFGGTTLYIPRDWELKVEVVSLLGGVDDKRFYDGRKPYAGDRVLVIKGFAIFGGCEIKDA